MTTIRQRRDTASAWTAAHPVLALGEIGWETDTRRSKLGDGTTAWTALDYVDAAPFGVTNAINPLTGMVHASQFDAKGDGQIIQDGAMSGTTAVLTSASALFVAGDVGKLVLVPGAGTAGAVLSTSIASFQSATQVTLTATSSTAVSGTRVTWGTDDTAAIQAAIDAAPDGATVALRSALHLTTAPLTITAPVHLHGAGYASLFGTFVDSSSTSAPTTPPFITGCAIVVCAPGVNGISITGTGIKVDFDGFAVRFADGYAWLNTGHGIMAAPTLVKGIGHDNGIVEPRWDGITVVGQDGNHYAYHMLNANLGTFTHLRGYGGGGLFISSDNPVCMYGNHVFIAPYFDLFVGGTADGYHLTSVTAGWTNLITFIRPQVNIQPIAGFPALAGLGIVGPTPGADLPDGQYLWRNVNNPSYISIYDPDFECPAYIPGVGGHFIDFGGAGGGTIVRNGGVGVGAAQGGFDSDTAAGSITINPGTLSITDGGNGIVKAAGTTGDLYLRAKAAGNLIRMDQNTVAVKALTVDGSGVGKITVGDGSNGIVQAGAGTPGDLYLRAATAGATVRVDQNTLAVKALTVDGSELDTVYAPLAPQGSGLYYAAPRLNIGSVVAAVGDLHLTRLVLAKGTVLSRIAASVATAGSAGSVVRLGIYADSGGRAGTLLLDAGTIDGTATGIAEITINQTIPTSGPYWLCAGAEVAAPTMTSAAGRPDPVAGGTAEVFGNGYGHAFAWGITAGGLPTTCPTWGWGASVTLVAVKVA